MAKKKHKSLFFGITSRVLMLIAAALLVLSYVSLLFNPVRVWISAIFGLLFLPMLLINIILLFWATLRKSKAAFIPLSVLLPSLLFIGRFYQPGQDEEAISTDGMKIMSYNVGRYRAHNHKSGVSSSKECADSITQFLKMEDPDIICLQEVYMKSSSELVSYFKKNFKGYNLEYFVYPTKNGCFGNVTLSKFKAIKKGKLDFEKSANLAIWCDYAIGKEKFRVYNCHLESYNISLPHIVQRINGDNYKKLFRDTERKMRQSIIKRPVQVDNVLVDIEKSPIEAIVVGDFNDTPMSYTYNRLLKHRKDSFVEAGEGYGATYSLFRPFLRIDYILFPKRLTCVDHKVIKKKFSDHYPVKAIIEIEKTK